MSGGAVHLRMRLSGTGDEDLLRLHTGRAGWEVRAHVCGTDCNQEEAAEDLVHVQVGRPMKAEGADEVWVTNLEPHCEAEVRGDEMGPLRAHAGLDPGAEGLWAAGAPPEKAPGEKEKKTKKEKKAKKKRKKEKECADSDGSGDAVPLDGSRPRLANQKKARWLFAGTGLDPKDRIRNLVARRARKFLRRKTEKSSTTGSGSKSQSSSSEDAGEMEESIFEQNSKVRSVAEHFPGALSSQTLRSMRSTLLQEIGVEDKVNTLPAVAISYYRQHLQRKASGPTARELMTLCHAVDQLVRARPASAMDTMLQRVKSIEQSLSGSHWSVSQRQEILPSDSTMLTPVPEATSAQKEVYQEARAKWWSTFPEGRAPRGGKGSGKGKGEGKDKNASSGDRDRKGTKGGGGKAEAGKKKES